MNPSSENRSAPDGGSRDVLDRPEQRAEGGGFGSWFGVFGGAIAWLIHLLLSYGIGEFGCVSGFRETRLLGITGVAWLEIGVSVSTAAVALAAVVVAQRGKRVVPNDGNAAHYEPSDPRAFMARSGVLASGLFLFIIVVQTLPILYFLRNC